MNPRLFSTLAVSALAGAALAGCSSSSDSTAASNTTATNAAACPIAVTDGWTKAAENGMSAAFGHLRNTSDVAVTVTAASSPASGSMELHEVADRDGKSVMQPVKGGFVVPADDTLTLEPGGYHLMLMDVVKPIEPGERVTYTLTCSGGGTTTISTLAKSYDGGNEKYKNGSSGMDMSHSAPMTSSAK